jgi:ABC-type branched-subunit amino acid transport system permease subunit
VVASFDVAWTPVWDWLRTNGVLIALVVVVALLVSWISGRVVRRARDRLEGAATATETVSLQRRATITRVVTNAFRVLVWATALVLLALAWFALRTPWGRVLRAIRDDEDAAASLGKNVFAYKLQALAVGAALGAVAGLFYAWQFSFFSPDDFAPLLTFFAWMIVILGGLGRAWTVPVGAIVFGVIFAGTRFFDFAPFSLLDSTERAYLRLILIGAVIIGLMLFRPQGILGKREEMVLE